MKWSAFTPDGSGGSHTFVGRGRELELLESGFAAGARVGMLSGLAGAGKTALAVVFGAAATRMFPDGVVHAPVGGGGPALEGSLRWPPGDGVLFILDDADTISREELRGLVDVVLNRRARCLIVTREPVHELAEFSVQLGDLTDVEAAELVEAFLDRKDDETTAGLVDALGGLPLGLTLALSWLQHHPGSTVADLTGLLRAFEHPGAVDLAGHALGDPANRLVTATVQEINDELLQTLSHSPERVFELDAHTFEKLVAELLSREGYTVSVTPSSRDGGKDIYAAAKSSLGSFLYVVECKLYAPHRPVGVALVRQLYGVVEAQRATAGILVTTSRFTGPARQLTETLPHRMSLRDYADLHSWLRHVAPVRPPS